MGRNEDPIDLAIVEGRVRGVLSEQADLPREKIVPEARLVEDLGLDSLAIVEVFLAIEEEFDIAISDAEAQSFFTKPATVRTLAEMVVWKRGVDTPREPARVTHRSHSAAVERMPELQLGGRLAADVWLDGPLYEPLGRNREGYAVYRRRTDGMRCVHLPGASVALGSDAPDTLPDQRPIHTVALSPLLIDAEPVCADAYARFLNSVGPVPPEILSDWYGVEAAEYRSGHQPLERTRNGWRPRRGTARQPIHLVSWYGANAYSLWANRRDWRRYRGDGSCTGIDTALRVTAEPPFSCLPTEAQWEYAARGEPAARNDARIDPPADAKVAQHVAGARYGFDEIPAAVVEERRGVSPFGLNHMAGNVWQWCRDWYDPGFYRTANASGRDPENREPTGVRGERGGSWVGPARLAHPAHRRGRPPRARGRCLGFRCIGIAADLENA